MFIFKTMAFLVGAVAFGVPAEYQVNVREGCRQAIAGAYLQALDEKARISDYMKTLKEQLVHLEAALKEADVEAKKAADVLAKQHYDIDVASRNDAATAKVKGLRAQITDYRGLLEKTEGQLPLALTKEKKLHDRIVKVFRIDHLADQSGGGYPIKITYRSDCPKFRAVCPLPPKEREALLEIEVDGEVPESCRRYVGLSHL